MSETEKEEPKAAHAASIGGVAAGAGLPHEGAEPGAPDLNQSSKEEETDDKPPPLGLKFWLAFWAVALCNLAASLDATTLSVALPAITEDIGGGNLEAFWAGTSYLLAETVVLLLWISLSDALGRQPTLLAALLIFAGGSIAGAVAQNYTVLIAGRVIQGLGGGGVQGLTNVLITDLVPLRQRGNFYALISIIWALGSTTGPIIGGACAQAGQWRWIFWLNLPIIAIGMLGVACFLHLTRQPGSRRSKLARIDYVGSGLFIGSVTAFLIPVTWGGTQFAWSSWNTLVPLLVGAAGMGATAFYVVRIARAPFIPIGIFSNYSTSIIYGGSFIHGLVLYSLMFFMPEYFQAVKGYSALIAGVAALPQTATIVPAAMAVGLAVGKTGRYRWAVWLGWGLATFGFGLQIMLGAGTTVPQWIFLAAVTGLGVGLLFPSQALALQSSVPQADVAMAATLVLFFRSFGQAVGIAVGSSILENRMAAELQSPSIMSLFPPGGLPEGGAIQFVARLREMPADAPLALALRDALSRSFQVIWATMCGLAGVTLLVHLVIKEYDMNQEHVTDQRLVREKQQNSADGLPVMEGTTPPARDE